MVDDALDDAVRDVRVPLNVSGVVAIRAGSIVAMADATAARFGETRDRALVDARAFALELNALHLLNVRVRGGLVVLAWRWANASLLLARHRALATWPTRRCALPAGRRASLAATAASLPSGLGGAAVVAATALAVGVPLSIAAAVALAITAGVAVHEAGHALLLGGVPAFVSRRGPRVAVVHRRLARRREARIALGGAVCGNVFALAVALFAWTTFAPVLAGSLAALAPHALALTIVTADGRRSCAA